MMRMFAWRALLLARVRVETRDVFSHLSARLLVGEGWLAFLSLALVLLASFSFAVSELGRWSPPPLLQYIRWYVELGSAFLVLGSLARLLEHVAPQRSLAQLPYLAPLSQASLHGAPLAAATLANLVQFIVAVLPALIIIGVRSGAGSAFYLRLVPVAGAISLSTALLGALLALPIALVCDRLHRRWREVPARFAGALVLPPLSLPLMWFLPRLVPPAPFPGGPVTPFSAASEVLTAAAVNEPTVAGAHLAAIVFGLALAFCAVYGQVRVPLAGYARRALHRVRGVSFRLLALLRAELAARAPLFLIAGAATGVLAGYAFGKPTAGPPPLLSLAVLIMWNLLAVFLVLPYPLVFASDVRPRLSGPLGDPVAFMLLRTSPYARRVYHLQLCLGLMGRTTLQILLSLLVCGGVLGWGAEFRQLLRYLPLLSLFIVTPATVLWQAVDLLSFGPRGQAHGAWLVWHLVWLVAVTWLVMSTGFLHATTIPVLVLRAVGLSVAHGAVAGAMLVWGVRRLERMDWL